MMTQQISPCMGIAGYLPLIICTAMIHANEKQMEIHENEERLLSPSSYLPNLPTVLLNHHMQSL